MAPVAPAHSDRDEGDFDLVVIGSGPAGQKAAIQAAKANAKVALVEQEADVGGMCVHRGTIPSKTLRETAVQLSRAHRHSEMAGLRLRDGSEVAALMSRLNQVVDAHVGYIGRQLDRNGVAHVHGRARFVSPTQIEVQKLSGEVRTLETALHHRGHWLAAAQSARDPGRPREHPRQRFDPVDDLPAGVVDRAWRRA